MSPASRAAVALGLMAGFYLLAVATGLGGFALAWLLVTGKSVGLYKFAFLSAAAGGTVLWSLRPRLDTFEAPGPRLTKAGQPELFGAIEDVARATGQSMPAEVYAVADVNAFVSTRGGVLGIGGRRVMGLGVPLLHLLTVDELKAVLAHEFGHYGGGDTKIGRLVYHTRLGLGRTLQAIEGKSIETLFAFYGSFVMRVSAGVSRHQEFAADRFAARATSGVDLANSLTKVDRHGSLFGLFYVSNMRPLLEERFWAPVGEGFRAFVADPMFNELKVSVTVGGPDAGEAPPDTAYDTHPSTEERIAALAYPPASGSRLPDSRVASSLVRELDELEFALFKPEDVVAAKLKRVAWPDVSPKVLVPRWRREALEREDILKQVRIEAPPSDRATIVQLGRTHGGLKMRLKDDPEVMYHVLFGIACGVATRLIARGWTPAPSPSLGCTFVRGEDAIDPMQQIFQIGNAQIPVGDWAAFCAREGLSGPIGPLD